jgi:hypothetical protein
MDEHRQQPEGASRQAVGALIGSIVGFGVAARQIFSEYEQAGQLPWVEGLAITMIGGVVGLIVATVLTRSTPDDYPPKPPPSPPGETAPDQRIISGDRVNGIERNNGDVKRP